MIRPRANSQLITIFAPKPATLPTILQDVDLQPYNTFGVSARAGAYAAVRDPMDINRVLDRYGEAPAWVLGGGSNVLLVEDTPGLVLHNQIPGIEVIKEEGNEVVIAAGGGVIWHELVHWTLDHGLGGLENLALIPGSVGAAPIQNIGAYGVELAQVFERLEALELASGRLHIFGPSDCEFGYRNSFFKQEGKGKFVISRVLLRLTRADHRINTSYGAIQQTLEERRIHQPTPRDVADAVIDIRQSKLPDWRVLGNAGSFFKNPTVSPAVVEELLVEYPRMPHYPAGDGLLKLAAGWLIDQRGWRGRREGAVGCYDKQALVIVNYGGATGREVLTFSERVAADVEAHFGVALEREVNVV